MSGTILWSKRTLRGLSHLHAVPARPADDHLANVYQPEGWEAEAYRALRHALTQLLGTHKRVVAVTSPGAGDGKTTTAISLAAALAEYPGSRVLLADTDLRSRELGRRLGHDRDGQVGLVDAV